MTRRRKNISKEEEDQILEHMQKDQPALRGIKDISIDVKCKTENQKKFIKLIKEKEIVIAAGFAGTGKTFLACAEALRLIKDPNSPYRSIILVKSVTALKGEEVGFLKGTISEKMMPYMYSFMSNFTKLIGKGAASTLEASGIIEVLPLAFIRGMNIDNSVIIVDECQNITIDNMKSIMTRIGENCKLIMIGDTKQIDLKMKNESSLARIMEKFNDIPEIGIMRFEKSDQVRNPIINIIEDVFEEIEKEGKTK